MAVDLLFVGDIMPGGVAHYQNEYVAPDVAKYLSGFDLRIGTLKSPISDEFIRANTKSNLIWTKSEDVKILTSLGVNVLSLASSHIFDLGLSGLEKTIEALDNVGIQHCGAGRNIEEASRPAVVECKGKKIAFLAYQDPDKSTGDQKYASETRPGVAPLIDSLCQRQICECKKRYDFVLILVQWGTEYSNVPRQELRGKVRRYIDWGVDGIFGAHAHVPQPIVKLKSIPVAYNLGNFYFPDFVCANDRHVCYPKNDITKLYRTEKYLKSYHESFVRVWPEISRICNTAEVQLGSQCINVKSKFLELSKSNILEKRKGGTFRLKLTLIGLLYELGYYEAKKRIKEFVKLMMRR